MLKFHIPFLISCLAFFTASLAAAELESNLQGYISSNDRIKLKQVFDDAWKLEDIALLHYAVASYQILNEKLPISSQDICNFVKTISSKSSSLEVLYHASSISEYVSSCSSSQFVNDVGTKLLQVTQKENVAMEELYYSVSILRSLKSNTTDVSFIIKALKNILKTNETLLNLGYALHVGIILPKKEMETLFDKVDSIIAQADEIDGRYLQFEGGLTLTALIIDGIYKLGEKLNKAPPLNNGQLIKFSNYFISRTTVSRPRGVFGLLQVLKTLSDNNFHVFVYVGPFENAEVSKELSTINVRVSDVFGEPILKSVATPVAVTLISLTKKHESNPVILNKPFTSTSDRTKFTLSSDGLNLIPGFYKSSISVAHPKGKVDKVIVNGVHNDVQFKVTTRIEIENFQIGIHNTEHSSSPSLFKLDYPQKLTEELNIDTLQRLMIKFSLKDIDYGKLTKVQQSFVQLINKKTKHEATFVCQSDSNRNFKLNLDLTNAAVALDYTSGVYDIIVILGDVLISPSIKWTVGDLKLKFLQDTIPEKNLDVLNYYLPKPEIKHLFREPEKRPPAVVSNVFTIFVLLPLFILFVLWLKLGVNLKNFPFTLSSIGFHLGLGSIFALFGIFWLQLNMFQTIKYLLILGAVTFLSGNKMLSDIAKRSKK